MLVVLGIGSLIVALATLRARNIVPYSNAGYAAMGVGLIVTAFYHAANFFALAGGVLVLIGALLLTYGAFFRKEIRNFRESLLPK